MPVQQNLIEPDKKSPQKPRAKKLGNYSNSAISEGARERVPEITKPDIVQTLLNNLKPDGSPSSQNGIFRPAYKFSENLELTSSKLDLVWSVEQKIDYTELLFKLKSRDSNFPKVFSDIIGPNDRRIYNNTNPSAFSALVVEQAWQYLIRNQKQEIQAFATNYSTLLVQDPQKASLEYNQEFSRWVALGLAKTYGELGLLAKSVNRSDDVLSKFSENYLFIPKKRAKYIENLLEQKVQIYFFDLVEISKSKPESKSQPELPSQKSSDLAAGMGLAASAAGISASSVLKNEIKSPANSTTEEIRPSQAENLISKPNIADNSTENFVDSDPVLPTSTAAISSSAITSTLGTAKPQSVQFTPIKSPGQGFSASDVTIPSFGAIKSGSSSVQIPAAQTFVPNLNTLASSSSLNLNQETKSEVTFGSSSNNQSSRVSLQPTRAVSREFSPQTSGLSKTNVSTGVTLPSISVSQSISPAPASTTFRITTPPASSQIATTTEIGTQITEFVRQNPKGTAEQFLRQRQIPEFNENVPLIKEQVAIERTIQQSLSGDNLPQILETPQAALITGSFTVVNPDAGIATISVPAASKISIQYDDSASTSQVVLQNDGKVATRYTLQIPDLPNKSVRVVDSGGAIVATKAPGQRVVTFGSKPGQRTQLATGLGSQATQAGLLAGASVVNNFIPGTGLVNPNTFQSNFQSSPTNSPASYSSFQGLPAQQGSNSESFLSQSPVPSGQRILPPRGSVAMTTNIDDPAPVSTFNQFGSIGQSGFDQSFSSNHGSKLDLHQIDSEEKALQYAEQNPNSRIYQTTDDEGKPLFVKLDDRENYRYKYGELPDKTGIITDPNELGNQERQDLSTKMNKIASGAEPANQMGDYVPGRFGSNSENNSETNAEERKLAATPNLGQDKNAVAAQNNQNPPFQQAGLAENQNLNPQLDAKVTSDLTNAQNLSPDESASTNNQEQLDQKDLNNQKIAENLTPENNIVPFKRKNSEDQDLTTQNKTENNTQAVNSDVSPGQNGEGKNSNVATLDKQNQAPVDADTQTQNSVASDSAAVGTDNPLAQKLNKQLNPKSGEGNKDDKNGNNSAGNGNPPADLNQSRLKSFSDLREKANNLKKYGSDFIKNPGQTLKNSLKDRLGLSKEQAARKIADKISKDLAGKTAKQIAASAMNALGSAASSVLATAGAAIGSALLPIIAGILIGLALVALVAVGALYDTHCRKWEDKIPAEKGFTNQMLYGEALSGPILSQGEVDSAINGGSSLTEDQVNLGKTTFEMAGKITAFKLPTTQDWAQQLEKLCGNSCDTGSGTTNAATGGSVDLTNKDCATVAFMETIAQRESNGNYFIRWPSTTYNPSTYGGHHPGISAPGPEGSSDAAGKYQMLSTTAMSWAMLAGKVPADKISFVTQVMDACNSEPNGAFCNKNIRAALDTFPYLQKDQDDMAYAYIQKAIGAQIKSAGTDPSALAKVMCTAAARQWASTPCGSQSGEGSIATKTQAFITEFLNFKKKYCGPNVALLPNPKFQTVTNQLAALPKKLFGSVDVEAADVINGKASFYGGPTDTYWEGRTTASGDVFKSAGYTAAGIDSLPFGVYKVTNKANGKSVNVKVNDRGAFESLGRTLDLSYGSAKAIGFTDGVADVQIEKVSNSVALGPTDGSVIVAGPGAPGNSNVDAGNCNSCPVSSTTPATKNKDFLADPATKELLKSPKIAVIHYTATSVSGKAQAADFKKLAEQPAGSTGEKGWAHYLIDKDGTNYQIVDEKYKVSGVAAEYSGLFNGDNRVTSPAIADKNGVNFHSVQYEVHYSPSNTLNPSETISDSQLKSLASSIKSSGFSADQIFTHWSVQPESRSDASDWIRIDGVVTNSLKKFVQYAGWASDDAGAAKIAKKILLQNVNNALKVYSDSQINNEGQKVPVSMLKNAKSKLESELKVAYNFDQDWLKNIFGSINAEAAETTPSLTNKTDSGNSNSDKINRGGSTNTVDNCIDNSGSKANLDPGFVEIVVAFAAKGGFGLHSCYETVWADLRTNYQKNPTSPWGKIFPQLDEATTGFSSDAYMFHDAMQRTGQNGKKVYDGMGLKYIQAKTQKDIDNAPVGSIMVVGSNALGTGPSGDINVKTGAKSYRNYGNMDNLMNSPNPNESVSGVYIYYP